MPGIGVAKRSKSHLRPSMQNMMAVSGTTFGGVDGETFNSLNYTVRKRNMIDINNEN